MNKKHIVAFFAFLLLCYSAFFLHLTSYPLIMWDESRVAMNAFEMLHNNKFIVTYFDGQPDMWNTKPPLMVWLMVLCMKIFGYNELAVRIISALSGVATAVFLFFLGKNYLKDIKIGIFVGLVLMTSIGYVGIHVTRTGDYDALVTLLITVYSLSFFQYLHEDDVRKKNNYFLLFGVNLILAALCKSIGGIIPLIGILIYALIKNKWKDIFLSKRIYVAALFFLIILGGYYLLREFKNSGYIKAFVENEFTGRYLSTIEGHEHPFDFYWQNFIDKRFIPWIYFLPFCFSIVMFSKNKIHKELSLFCLILILSYFFIISFAQTKLTWYDAPLYPFASLIIGIGFKEVYDRILLLPSKNIFYYSIFVFCIFYIPYKNMIDHVTHEPEEAKWEQVRYGSFMKEMAKKKTGIKSYTILSHGYNSHLFFYKKIFSSPKWNIQNLDIKEYNFKQNDTIVSCDSEIKSVIEQQYIFDILYGNNYCNTYVIRQKKLH